ncbi:MAG: hypothetical protein JW779_08605 [Candidatus Thorarchaeota archaeon]|nr:hypothetical protein [Candidatus Thorarchaeota archaeon]
MMQSGTVEVGYLTVAILMAVIVWLAVFRYKLWGLNLANQSKSVAIKQGERGLWYANNINSPVKEGLFSAMHFGLVIVTIWSVLLLFTPSYFLEVLESYWIALPAFVIIGFVIGSIFGINIENPLHDESEDESTGTE